MLDQRLLHGGRYSRAHHARLPSLVAVGVVPGARRISSRVWVIILHCAVAVARGLRLVDILVVGTLVVDRETDPVHIVVSRVEGRKWIVASAVVAIAGGVERTGFRGVRRRGHGVRVTAEHAVSTLH